MHEGVSVCVRVCVCPCVCLCACVQALLLYVISVHCKAFTTKLSKYK